MLKAKLYMKVFSPKYRNFYSRSTFWDSYFDHGCMIALEEDVLYTDIDDRRICACIRRWWHDLFLLSYNSSKARYFYLSSFAIKSERTKQYQHYQKSIHPLCPFRIFWNHVITYAAICNTIGLSLGTSVIYGESIKFFRTINIACEILFIIDILINFRTGYVDESTKTIVLDLKKISLHYMSSMIFFHVLSAIPYQMILILMESNETLQCSLLGSVIRLLSMFRILRLIELTRYWASYERVGPTNYFYQLLRITILSLVSMNYVLHFSDTVSLLDAIVSGEMPPECFLAYMLVQKYVVKRSAFHLYCLDMSRVLKAFTLSSSGNYRKMNPIDRLLALVIYFVGAFFFMWGLLEAITYVFRYNYIANERIIAIDRTKNVLRARQLPDCMSSRITDYYSFYAVDNILPQRKNEMYSILPATIRREISVLSYRKLLANVECFSSWPLALVDEMALLLNEEIYLKGDTVASAWTPGECLVIVDTGVLAVYSVHGVETGHLIDTDYFGELSLVTDKELRMSSVIAITNCCALTLYKQDFSFTFVQALKSYLLFMSKIDISLKRMRHRAIGQQIIYSLNNLFIDMAASLKHMMRKYPGLFFGLKKYLRNKYYNYRRNSDGFE